MAFLGLKSPPFFPPNTLASGRMFYQPEKGTEDLTVPGTVSKTRVFTTRVTKTATPDADPDAAFRDAWAQAQGIASIWAQNNGVSADDADWPGQVYVIDQWLFLDFGSGLYTAVIQWCVSVADISGTPAPPLWPNG